MPQPSLQGSGIVPGVRQREAAGMPQHVGMDRKGHARTLAEPRNERVEALGRHRPTPLSREHMRPWRLLALKTPECAELIPLDRMHARRSSFGAADVETPQAAVPQRN